MFLRKLFFTLVIGLSAHFAWASTENFCTPSWRLDQRGYDRCSSLPILTPSNDTRVNFKLLLVDDGLATLEAKPATKEEAEYSGYGKVPFTVENFESNIFIAGDGSNSKDEPPVYGGTRCDSNETGKEDFIDALKQTKDVSTAERKELTEERQKLKPTCVDLPVSKTSKNVDAPKETSKMSTTYRQFTEYLTAATAFYEGRYGEAESHFAHLTDSRQPWLKESSRYMLGRTQLNLSQQNAFDSEGFPDLKKVDKKALLEAEAKFNNYLKDYPSGRYAASARGLLRRIYWLSEQQQKLADEYQWQLKHPKSPQHNLSINSLVHEADVKLLDAALPQDIKSPLLLATLDLSLMRPTGSSGTARISLSDLQKQQSSFADCKALYEYLLAAHYFYVQKDAANALKMLPDTVPSKMTYLDFSRLILRGLALEATKDHLAARKLWLKLLPISRQPLQNETLQLALALNYERSNEVKLAFEANSPITDTTIRNILLRNDASPALLRQVIKSKNNSDQEPLIALYTLLYKDLLRGHYKDFIQDYPLLPADAAKYTPLSGGDYVNKPHLAHFTWSGKKSDDSYSCPSTLDIAGRLAKNAEDPYGLICLGDFVKFNDLEVVGYSAQQSSGVNGGVLGSAPSDSWGKLFSRGGAYKIIIADASAAPDLKAYALYRAIRCYAPSGFNDCGGDDVDKSVRKSWFRTLKTRYRNSVWAKSLEYYW